GFNSELVLPKYIYYYMRAHFKKHALSRSVKATVDSLRLPTIKEFKVKVPEMAVQKQIVAILDNLDYQVKKGYENKNKLVELKNVYLNNIFI
uniref:restriction endonuclease subunit S n=1 Tax=Nosocomiicoccus massiliensis TaxID=1232430 RepID=UPI000593F2F5